MKTKILKKIIDNSREVNINGKNEVVINSKLAIDLMMEEWREEIKELKKLTNKNKNKNYEKNKNKNQRFNKTN